MTEAAATPTTSASSRRTKRAADQVDASPGSSACIPVGGLRHGECSPVDGGAGKRREARALFWMGWKLSHIAEQLGVPRGTLHGWHKTEGWADAPSSQRVEAALEARMVTLIAKDVKTGGDYKEIDLLGRQLERLARIGKYSQSGREADLNPAIESRNAGPKKKPQKNHFTEEQVEKVCEAFLDSIFDYQRTWWEAAMERTRIILKSRQIGATWYFAREALVDALKTGRNQIFLSASKAQAYLFRNYILRFAWDVCGIELKGDPLILSNGAELRFLGTNSKTAQGYHGNLYFDEFFWTNGFATLNDVASGMASHKQWRMTYFSTPSSVQHEAYEFWTGKHLRRPVEIDVSHSHLQHGAKGADAAWRQIVTVLDAERGGCDLFDIEDLRRRKSEEVFDNLYMCGFVDDSFSVFPLTAMQRCMVDSWEVWKDFKPFVQRPFGWQPVWIGYDPSHTGDRAGLVVVAPPVKPGGPLRVLHTQQFQGMDFDAQARAIKDITSRYNVAAITVDTTGIGQGVFQLVQKFFPAVRGINYSVDSKTMLVLKAQQVINAGRLEFDSGNRDLASSFMAIKRELTASGRSVTYAAGRSQDTGHSDLAWAAMNAISNEPLDAGTGLANVQGTSFLEISE
ncbi:terminase large subunit domain-containing protein [Paracidovorax konjaci]|nr:terminase family protein [Paracidovorax konjaci]